MFVRLIKGLEKIEFDACFSQELKESELLLFCCPRSSAAWKTGLLQYNLLPMPGDKIVVPHGDPIYCRLAAPPEDKGWMGDRKEPVRIVDKPLVVWSFDISRNGFRCGCLLSRPASELGHGPFQFANIIASSEAFVADTIAVDELPLSDGRFYLLAGRRVPQSHHNSAVKPGFPSHLRHLAQIWYLLDAGSPSQ